VRFFLLYYPTLFFISCSESMTHSDMLNSGVHEYTALGDKAMGGIKGLGVNLRRQNHFKVPMASRLVEQGPK
jgi:hypothetical protein